MFPEHLGSKVEAFVQELRKLNLSVAKIKDSYEKSIAIYDINHFLRFYLRTCSKNLKERVLTETEDDTKSQRFIEFYDLELSDSRRIQYLFKLAYGEEFLRSIYLECYRIFIDRQQASLKFIKKCTFENQMFDSFRSVAYDLDRQLD